MRIIYTLRMLRHRRNAEREMRRILRRMEAWA